MVVRVARRAVVLMCAMVLTACSSADEDAHIVAPGFAGAGVGIEDTRPGIPYTVGDLIICLDRSEWVILDRIELNNPSGGLVLDAFAVIPNEMERARDGFSGDNQNKTLAELGVLPPPGGSVAMYRACPDFEHMTPGPSLTPHSVALLLQYSKPTTATAASEGITIHYTSGGHPYWVSLPWEIVLCAPDDTTTYGCRGA